MGSSTPSASPKVMTVSVSKATTASVLVALVLGFFIGRWTAPSADLQRPLEQPLTIEDASKIAAEEAHKQLHSFVAEQQEFLKNNPDSADGWARLGDAYFDLRQPESAIPAYEKSLALEPNNPNVLVDCGIMFRVSGNYEKALEFFRKAIAINPTHQNAYFNSGVVLYHDLNKKDEAIVAWKKLLEINPNARTPDGTALSAIIENH